MTESTFDPLFEATVAERRRLVGLLSELTEEQWAHHSLFKGWRVREVVAHITAAYRLTPETVMAGVAAAAGDWNAACKRDTAQYSDAELLASLAENVTHPWQPPGGGQAGALSHDVIHGLDITEPLGLPRTPVKRVELVLAQPRRARPRLLRCGPHRPTPRGGRLRMVDGRRRRRRRSTRGRPPPEDRRETSALTCRATGAGEPDQGRYSWTPGAGECD
jgi:uncharacterized protein (TIGR03083 family)